VRPVDRLHPPAQEHGPNQKTDLKADGDWNAVGESDDRAGEEAGLHLSDPIDRLPEGRRERARSALAAAFGRSPVHGRWNR